MCSSHLTTATVSYKGMEWIPYSTRGCPPTQRYGHATICIGNSILVIGGKSGSRGNIEVFSVEFNPPSSVKWHQLNPLQPRDARSLRTRWGFACCYVEAYEVIFFHGGFDSECNYADTRLLGVNAQIGPIKSNLNRLVWYSHQVFGDDPTPRAYHSAVSYGGVVYVFGGQCCIGGPYEFYNDVYTCDLSTCVWAHMECTGSIPSPRSQHAAFIYEGHMYIYGGYNGTETFNSLYKLNLCTFEWTHITTSGSLPPVLSGLRPRDFRVYSCRCSSVVCGDKLLILSESYQTERFQFFELNLKKLQWRVVGTKREGPYARGNATMNLVMGSLCVLGGHARVSHDPSDGFATVWTLPLPRKLHWECEKLLWIGCYKNDPRDCVIARLPPVVIHRILDFVNAGFYLS